MQNNSFVELNNKNDSEYIMNQSETQKNYP